MPSLDRDLLEILACPRCKGPLEHAAAGAEGGREELRCRACRLAYEVREGIPVMLAEEARALDT